MEGNSGRDWKGREVVEIGLCCSQDLSFKIDLKEMKKKKARLTKKSRNQLIRGQGTQNIARDHQ